MYASEGGGAHILVLQYTQKAPKKESMITKSRERSRAKRSLNRNFKSGDVKANEHYLNRVGLRGRKRWVCLGLFIVIYLIAVAHLVVRTFTHTHTHTHSYICTCTCAKHKCTYILQTHKHTCACTYIHTHTANMCVTGYPKIHRDWALFVRLSK